MESGLTARNYIYLSSQRSTLPQNYSYPPHTMPPATTIPTALTKYNKPLSHAIANLHPSKSSFLTTLVVLVKILPEAQRTQGIESITQIIAHGKTCFRGEMKYKSDYNNQAWSLKLKKSSVRTLSTPWLPPFSPCTPPCRPTHPPPYLNDNHLPNALWVYQ